MTVTDFVNAGVPIEDTPVSLLYAESALEWIKEHTTLSVDCLDTLPSSAKLFILKYSEIMETNAAVTSESIGGMSQSFSTANKNALVYDTAMELLGPYLKSAVTFVGAQNRWI